MRGRVYRTSHGGRWVISCDEQWLVGVYRYRWQAHCALLAYKWFGWEKSSV